MASEPRKAEELKARRKVYGEACRRWRDMQGISQQSMAIRLGLTDAKTYSRYEGGDLPWTLELLEQVAREVEAGSVSNLLTSPDRVSIQHANQANNFSQTNNYHEASAKEREQLLARIEHLEGEVDFLRDQLRRAQSS
jgi:transcriptional regulator with XRE-family HTH domain